VTVKVLIPSPLFSYTGGKKDVEARGATLAELLGDLERQFPGIRFRVVDEQDQMRPHMRFFVNGEQVFELTLALKASDAVQIVQALSGG
jgi:molybdopterin converting factor small subunit